MATIIKRQTKSGPRWQLQVRLPGMKAIVKTFDTEDQAKLIGATIEKKAREAFTVQPILKPSEEFYATDFKTAIEEYLNCPLATKKDRQSLASAQRLVGSVKMGQLTREFAKAYADRLLKTRSKAGRTFKPATIAKHYSAMSKVYRWKAEFHQLPYKQLPFTLDLLPRNFAAPREQRVDKHQERLLKLSTKGQKRESLRHLRLLIGLALETAARLQELVLAEWSEFDLENGLWTIPAHHEKTARGRMVPLSPRARRILKVLEKIKTSDARVFHQLRSPTCATLQFHFAAKRAKVSVRFHDLRHEAITRMVKRYPDLPPMTLMKIVGHSSVQMLDRYYNPNANDLKGLFG